jgi:predicted RNA binding protein YcfA (HicA-like mRNA interferase family)
LTIADTTLVSGVPRKIRELIAELERAGFVNRGGKGSHRNFKHPKGGHITVSGKPGDDVPRYLERDAARELEKCR